MEDAATAEISRTQIWQWLHNDRALLDSGEPVTAALVESLIPGQLEKIRAMVGDDSYGQGKYDEAAEMFRDLVFSDQLAEFLTLGAYERIAGNN